MIKGGLVKFYSTKRFNLALTLAVIDIIYIFNFVSIYVNILESRSLGRQIFAYILNIAIFTVIFYLVLTFFVYLYTIITRKK